MRGPNISLCGLLWVWLPLFHGQPLEIDKLKADSISLIHIIQGRIQEQEFPPVNMQISGIDFIPEQLPAETLESIDETLLLFHQVLASLPLKTQISNDVENLRTMIQMLASQLGCPFSPSASDYVGNLKELMEISPYTAAAVTLDRLQKCLENISNYLSYVQSC